MQLSIGLPAFGWDAAGRKKLLQFLEIPEWAMREDDEIEPKFYEEAAECLVEMEMVRDRSDAVVESEAFKDSVIDGRCGPDDSSWFAAKNSRRQGKADSPGVPENSSHLEKSSTQGCRRAGGGAGAGGAGAGAGAGAGGGAGGGARNQ
eukprot:766850-Hanusia_phi.AAC.9